MQIDRYADRDMTKLIATYHKSVNASKKMKIKRHLYQGNIAKQNRLN